MQVKKEVDKTDLMKKIKKLQKELDTEKKEDPKSQRVYALTKTIVALQKILQKTN